MRSEQIAIQSAPAPEGPVEMEIGFRVGPARNWAQLWKPAIDALDPILGRTRPDRAYHPRDDRLVRLGLHRLVDSAAGWMVEIGVWWRLAVGGERRVGLAEESTPGEDASARDDAADRSSRHPRIERFIEQDDAYRAWRDAHPGGFVVNANRQLSDYETLRAHAATCVHLRRDVPSHPRLTHTYIKVCAMDARVLDEWSLEVFGRGLRSRRCRVCLPETLDLS